MASLNVAFGTMSFAGKEALIPALEAIKSVGITAIDTAQMYGTNEADLGASNAASMGFTISTKNWGGWKKGEALKPEALIRTTKESLQALGVDQVDIFYIHGPDRTMELNEWVPTVQVIYEQGLFKRFGVSNFSAQEVQNLWEYSKSNGYVLPTVYQGNYNAVSRHIETTLFPTLRNLNIAFYAYSPVAGGFLTKSAKALREGTEEGRFTSDPEKKTSLGTVYQKMYLKPTMIDALERWSELAQQEKVSNAELAYRWVYYHSSINPELGDHLILGASRLGHIESTVHGLKKGPLKPEVARGVDDIWASIKADAIVNNFDEINP
ncbi:NADP-dependent oxidoreductase domain-containing protein [Penicillium verhagenii]|nr:NADP-dependent oxidoreductase domain-containing protein [Penicillium verhagenii]